jgi:hypothetical protein
MKTRPSKTKPARKSEKCSAPRGRKPHAYPVALRLKAVRLHFVFQFRPNPHPRTQPYPRPVLDGNSAHQRFAARTLPAELVTAPERNEIKNWIDARRQANLDTMKGAPAPATLAARAYRHAVQSVLEQLRILTVQNHV